MLFRKTTWLYTVQRNTANRGACWRRGSAPYSAGESASGSVTSDHGQIEFGVHLQGTRQEPQEETNAEQEKKLRGLVGTSAITLTEDQRHTEGRHGGAFRIFFKSPKEERKDA